MLELINKERKSSKKKEIPDYYLFSLIFTLENTDIKRVMVIENFYEYFIFECAIIYGLI